MAKMKRMDKKKLAKIQSNNGNKRDFKRLARQIATGAGLSAALMLGACSNGANPMTNNDIVENGPTQEEIDTWTGKDTTKAPITINEPETDDRDPITIDYPEDGPITINEPEEEDEIETTEPEIDEPTTPEIDEPTDDRNPITIEDDEPTTSNEAPVTPEIDDDRNPITIDY